MHRSALLPAPAAPAESGALIFDYFLLAALAQPAPGLPPGIALATRISHGRFTPCVPASDGEVANSLAIVHAELVLLHPFRDGNGRMARLLALLMALQAGLPPLDFSPLDGRGKRRYIAGIQAAVGGDYRLLTEMFKKVIDRTWKSVSSSGR